MVGVGPNNPSSPTSYNPLGGLTVPFYINVDKIRGINYEDDTNRATLKIWIEGGGAGFANVTTQSEVLIIYGKSIPPPSDPAVNAEIGQRAVQAFVNILENSNQDSNIIEFPFVEGFNEKTGECTSMEIKFNT